MAIRTTWQQKSSQPSPGIVAGSFKPGKYNVYAIYTLPVASGDNMLLTSSLAGVAGNALDFQATADGTAKAEFDFSTVCTNLDTVIEFNTGGVGGNDWDVVVAGGSKAGDGVSVYEDTTNKVLTVMYEDAVSTVANFETAIGTTTNFAVKTGGTGASVLAAGSDDCSVDMAGGTVATWAEESGTPSKMHLHYTDAVTTVDAAIAAIAAPTVGTAYMVATVVGGGTGVHALAAGDAVAKQDLSGGVDAVAIGTLLGGGFTVSQTAIGTYTLIAKRRFRDMTSGNVTMQLNTPDAFKPMLSTFDQTARSVVISLWEMDGTPAVADQSTVHADDRIHFILHMQDM